MTASMPAYAPHSAMPAPAMPSPAPPVGDEQDQKGHVEAEAEGRRGQVREVTRARPAITGNPEYRP